MVAESVMYKRRTGLEICNENNETIFIEIDKKCHLTGDYNINILWSDDHGDTSDFLDTVYSHAYVPLTKKPTRITEISATLIDNIYSNCIDKCDFLQGILLTDIFDHLPVFVIIKDLITERTRPTLDADKPSATLDP